MVGCAIERRTRGEVVGPTFKIQSAGAQENAQLGDLIADGGDPYGVGYLRWWVCAIKRRARGEVVRPKTEIRAAQAWFRGTRSGGARRWI